jgi:hypothetical protein
MTGLVVSSIDKWFMGPVPQFTPRDLGVPTGRQNLTEVLKRARSVVKNPAQMAWQDVGTFDRQKTGKVLIRSFLIGRVSEHQATGPFAPRPES